MHNCPLFGFHFSRPSLDARASFGLIKKCMRTRNWLPSLNGDGDTIAKAFEHEEIVSPRGIFVSVFVCMLGN